ncbi:MAG: imidazolonepropionase [Dongiaceae bacterium]
MYDALFTHARLATMRPGGAPYGAIEEGAIAVENGRIAWVGPMAALPQRDARERHDLAGRWVTPGLVDCHTHLVHGGDRAAEFELRLQGASYEEIARAGGGIRSTVAATRAASEAELLAAAESRLKPLLAEGLTVVEIKSGYGLEREAEMKQLRVARALGQRNPVRIRTTFLAAHALPPEYEGRADDYITAVVEEMLPAAHAAGLVDAVDAFCERIGFTPAQTERVFKAAAALGLPVKLHAEQLSDLKGAVLAARYKALSADHLEYVEADGIAAMAAAGTVAVLLPGAFYFLRETKLPPVEALRQARIPIALSTDCNPGSSPATSLLLMLNMAATFFRMTPEEALAGVTRHAAQALGMAASHGTIEAGKAADLAIWDIERPAELAYRIGFNPLHRTVKGGVSCPPR